MERVYRSGSKDLPILRNLDFRVGEGEQVAIVGESGSGKSTLLHLLGGLDRPTKGQILYRGTEVTAMRDAALAEYRNQEIGFVWQIHYLLPEFTALENVMMPLLVRGESRSHAAQRAMECLNDVALSDRAHHRSGELSGGEQQRVVLARALVGKPSLLLADEPTGNLDTQTGERIFALVADLHRQHRLSSVLVTHNIAFASRCDRVLRMEHGTLTTVY